jgi:hypothetical protein
MECARQIRGRFSFNKMSLGHIWSHASAWGRLGRDPGQVRMDELEMTLRRSEHSGANMLGEAKPSGRLEDPGLSLKWGLNGADLGRCWRHCRAW